MICRVELGELESRHAEFAKRQVKVVVISNDDRVAAGLNQQDYPHLTVVADTDQAMAKALHMIHPRASNTGGDTNAPTMVLVDGNGVVRWYARSPSIMNRQRPDDVLRAIDQL